MSAAARGTYRVRIEMEVPDELDQSEVLDAMQAVACAWYEDHKGDEEVDCEDPEHEGVLARYQEALDHIADTVSVERI